MTYYELKKVFVKTSSKAALGALLILLIVFSFFSVNSVNYVNENGETEKGRAAAASLRQEKEQWEGPLTAETVARVIRENSRINQSRDCLLYTSRLVKVFDSTDLAIIAHEGANLSGSGICIGLQSRGTIVIHHKDQVPLDNLELFPQCPLYDLKEMCRRSNHKNQRDRDCSSYRLWNGDWSFSLRCHEFKKHLGSMEL